MNYLTVSFYTGQFTYNHEQAWARLNEMYDIISKTPSVLPSWSNVKEFYSNIVILWRVTETDDPDYYTYINQFKRHIAAYNPNSGDAAAARQTDEDTEDAENAEEAEEDAMYQQEQECRRYWEPSECEQEWENTDWLAKEREDWTESIRFKNRNCFYGPS